MPGLMALREEYGAAQPLKGAAHHRLLAHDHPDRSADRDAGGAGCRGALGDLQHLSRRKIMPPPRSLQAASPCSRSRAKPWLITGGLMSGGYSTGATEEDPDLTCNMILGRWRQMPPCSRCGVHASKRARKWASRPTTREVRIPARPEGVCRRSSGLPHPHRQGDQGCVGRNHHGRDAPLPDRQAGQASLPCHSTSMTA